MNDSENYNNENQEGEKLTKEEVNKLLKIKGETRGTVFKTDKEYILKNEGEEGLRLVENELERLGCPIHYEEIENMSFFPVGLRAISLLVIKQVFNYNDERIKEMGLIATKTSFFIRLFAKFLISVEKLFSEKSVEMWKKHWTVGELVPVELNQEKKYAIVRLKNFNLHKIYCSAYFRGFLSGILQMVVNSKDITCQEVKCSLDGDDYHEYLLKWE